MEEATYTNINSFAYLEISKNPLNTFYEMVNEILVPLLDYIQEKPGLSDLLSMDLMEKLNE